MSRLDVWALAFIGAAMAAVSAAEGGNPAVWGFTALMMGLGVATIQAARVEHARVAAYPEDPHGQ